MDIQFEIMFIWILINMIIKTIEFDEQFRKDTNRFLQFGKTEIWQKGSYKIKENGDTITDIDLQANVWYDDRLLKVISDVLNRTRNSPFVFIRMAVGRYKGYELPWIIDNSGSCNFNPRKVKQWFDWFKPLNLVPQSVIEYIGKKLFAPQLVIKDLIDIENAIFPYAEIVWKENDIKNGYINRGKHTYKLLDEMKTETPVLEFAYNYGSEYIAVDLGVVDRNHKVAPKDDMYKYYTQDWYKIMKNFRWKLQEQYKPEYFGAMRQIDAFITLKYQLELLEKIIKYKSLPDMKIKYFQEHVFTDLENIGENSRLPIEQNIKILYEKINAILEKSVFYFSNFLESEDKNKILFYIERGINSTVPVSHNDIAKRYDKGNVCPFFSTNMVEFEILVDLAIRIDIEPEEIIKCFSDVSEKIGQPMNKVIKEVVGNNDYFLKTVDSEIILYQNFLEKGRYPLEKKHFLQTFVLVKNLQG